MSPVWRVAADLLREAMSRKWFLGLFIAVTLVLCVIGLSLRMDVVDGALAGISLFGKIFDDQVMSVDVALRPVFAAATAMTYFGGTLFLILACADFGPELFAPGRIEQLLSLPVRRWQLLLGTWLGVQAIRYSGAQVVEPRTVLAISVGCLLYAAAGLMLGVWQFERKDF